MKLYRVECNFGCKYFQDALKGFAYFNKCKNKGLNVEIWLLTYNFNKKKKIYYATQELLDYSLALFTRI